jgi:hypothetical protein
MYHRRRLQRQRERRRKAHHSEVGDVLEDLSTQYQCTHSVIVLASSQTSIELACLRQQLERTTLT